MITLREMLKIKGFEGMKIIAGSNGIDRLISTVSVMDAPDIYKWMKGGEFLITTAYSIKDDLSYIRELIIKLNASGASAFGVKLHRYIDAIPDEAVAIADELNFPIISIPIEFSFADVINPVLKNIIDVQGELLRFSEVTHKSFTDLVINGKSIEEVLNVLSNIINKETAFIDITLNNIIIPKESKNLNVLLSELDIENIKFNFNKDIYIYNLKIRGELIGYLAIWVKNDELSKQDIVAVEHASTVIILAVQRIIATKQVEQKYRDEFVNDLITNNIKSEAEILNRAHLYRFNINSGAIVVLVDIDNMKQSYINIIDEKKNQELNLKLKQIFDITRRIVKSMFLNLMYSKLSDHIIFIISSTDVRDGETINKLESLFKEAHKEINEKSDFTVTVAIGSYKSESMDIYKSYNEAKKCLGICRSIGIQNQTIFYERLGIYKLLSTICNSDEADEFFMNCIGDVIEYDKSSKMDLLKTLTTLAECNWNLKETARKLYIHYNSIKYRYKKISELVNADLGDYKQRLQIEIALELYKIKS